VRKGLAQEEELKSIRAYDLAKASGEKPVSFDQAVREIESGREGAPSPAEQGRAGEGSSLLRSFQGCQIGLRYRGGP
jgi:hypothetical protein